MTSKTIPEAPVQLSIESLGSHLVRLHWLDPATTEAGFYVERSMDGIDFKQIAVLTKNKIHYDDPTVLPDETYYYRVRAYNKQGDTTGYTNVSGVITMAAPSDLFALFADVNRVDLTWKDNSVKEEKYRVERSEDEVTFEPVAELPLNTESYSDHQVSADKIYWYRVIALNDFGSSSASDTVSSGHLFDVWASAFGGSQNDRCDAALQALDGGFVMVGQTESFGSGNQDMWVGKSDPLGKSLFWEKALGGSLTDYATGVDEFADGRLVVVGTTASYANGKGDLWVILMDPDGNILWEEAYDAGKDEFGHAVGCAVSPFQTDSIIVAASSNAYNLGATEQDLWLLHLRANDGSVIWQNHFKSLLNDEPRAIHQTEDKGFIMAGITSHWGAGGTDTWVQKLNADGKVTWQYVIGGAEDDSLEAIRAVQGGGYLAAGKTRSFGEGAEDCWLLKLSDTGQVEWSITCGGADEDRARALMETDDGDYLVAGYSRSFASGSSTADAWLLNLEPDGSTLNWQFLYGGAGDEYIHALAPAKGTNDRGFILTGSTDSFGAGMTDVWGVVVDKLGLIEFAAGSGAEIVETHVTIMAAPVQSVKPNAYPIPGVMTQKSTSASVQETQCQVQKQTP